MQTTKLGFKISANEAVLDLAVCLDGKIQWQGCPGTDAQDITVEFDDIEIDQIVSELAEYHHNFNGTQPAIVDQFYGEMGCNGTLRLEFTTPIYLWLLENM